MNGQRDHAEYVKWQKNGCRNLQALPVLADQRTSLQCRVSDRITADTVELTFLGRSIL